jgi:hypothetical protein
MFDVAGVGDDGISRRTCSECFETGGGVVTMAMPNGVQP